MAFGTYPAPSGEIVAVDETLTQRMLRIAGLCRRLEMVGTPLVATLPFADRDTIFLNDNYPFRTNGLFGYIDVDPVNRWVSADSIYIERVCVNEVHVAPARLIAPSTRMNMHFGVSTGKGPAVFKLGLVHQRVTEKSDQMSITLEEFAQNRRPYANATLPGTRYDALAHTSILIVDGKPTCMTIDPAGRPDESMGYAHITREAKLAIELLDAVIIKPITH